VCTAAGYEQCAGKLLRLLERLVYLRDITPDYTYYGIASPWLQTKVLRALQYIPLPEGTGAQKQLHDVLQGIFNGEPLSSSSPSLSACLHQHVRALVLAWWVGFTRSQASAFTAARLVMLCATCSLW
jgi:hypothetical protein